MGPDEHKRLVRNIAGSRAQVAHFQNADPEYGARIEAELKERHG